MPPVLRVLFVGSSDEERARLQSHLALTASTIHFDVCGEAEEALSLAGRERVDALLVGPFDDLREVPLQEISLLVERDDPPVFLLLGAVAWSEIDWESLPCAGVDAVLEWKACRGPRLLDVLRYNISRARSARRNRSACVRGENMVAALTRLASVTQLSELPQVAVDAAIALRASGCALLLAERDDVVLAHARGIDPAQMRALARCTVSLCNHPVAEAVQTRRAVWSCAVEGSYAALPLVFDDEVAGVMWLRAQRPDLEDQGALERLAGHVAQALSRAQLTERLRERAISAERLVSVTGHDLRSPLQVIGMGAGLLQMDDAVAPAKRFLVQRIQESADRAGGLVAELLALAKSKRGQSASTLTSACAFAVASDCVADFQVRMPECPITLSTTGSGTAPLDRDHLMQVLHNLLANAAHYRETGSTVEVRGVGAADRVYLEVHNRGPVIHDDRMAELFAPMKRGVSGGERGSIGLGLYIVRTLVECDGGRVWARSSEAEGTTFVIALPRVAKPAESPRPADAVEPFRTAPVDVPPAYAALLESIPEGPLSVLLAHWLELGGASHLPHPQQLDRARLLAHVPDMFWVDVLRDAGGHFQFRFRELGGVLERRLDGCGADDLIRPKSGARLRPSLREAYGRCATTRRPAYDYLRSGPSHAREESFMRLVLPFSRDGENVTHLIGMALFHGFSEATHSAAGALHAAQVANEPSAAEVSMQRRSAP